jgi:hypothetical protein
VPGDFVGLDGVEFVLAVEEAFGISIPDDVAPSLITPKHVVDYIATRLPMGDSSACFSQRAFYRLRGAVVKAYQIPRRRVRPETPWDAILPDRGPFRSSWRHLQNAVGVPDWPRQHFLGFRLPSSRTVGDTAEYLAQRTPHLFKEESEAWSRSEIERIVTSLIATELGIQKFDWNDSFVRDLGVS